MPPHASRVRSRSRQAYPPASGQPGGRWSSACTSSTGWCRAGRQARLTAICRRLVFPACTRGDGAVTGARARQTETPGPRARAVAVLWLRSAAAQVSRRG